MERRGEEEARGGAEGRRGGGKEHIKGARNKRREVRRIGQRSLET